MTFVENSTDKSRSNIFSSCLVRMNEEWGSVLEPVVIKPGQVLSYEDARATILYFPINCVVADLVSPTSWFAAAVQETDQRTDDSIQVGIYGPEDVVGLPGLLSVGISGRRSVVEFGGHALRCQVSAARRIMERDPGSREVIHSYVALLLEELGQQAAAEQRLDVSDRVAAYLWRMVQASGENVITITHAHISKRLGARRPSVTESINALVKLGIIEQIDRGRILIKSFDEIGKIVKRAWPAMQNTREVFRSRMISVAIAS
ncbi:hypothetical protein JHFBIEKO_2330 [Methylobacterium mesophilicum]|uniref:Crp/Fnr family transcriptional regulator n=2 Tax=Methylobacterium mesophilicum TaxID=39956 RepID=UPI001EE1EB7F|nr:Crp/Fnr family transcriptional regulator [Methylobacterium mesophilicum]GJE21881.1 hypothetical protein JHFBIEKO_2330 [Methylobacterium mesophilicum]